MKDPMVWVMVAAGLAFAAAVSAVCAAAAAWKAKAHLESVTDGLEQLLAEGMAAVPLTRGAAQLVAGMRTRRILRQQQREVSA